MSEFFAVLSGRQVLRGECPAAPVAQGTRAQTLLEQQLHALLHESARMLPMHREQVTGAEARFQAWGTAAMFRLGNSLAILLGTLFQRTRLARRLGLPIEAAQNGAELLLHAHRHFGDAMIGQLTGEFAFVLWDGQGQRLLLGRDTSGSYPLYTQCLPGGVALASDISLMPAATGEPLRINERRTAHWLALVPSEPGATFFQGIENVPTGTLLEYRDGRLNTCHAWNPLLLPTIHFRDEQEYGEQLRSVLDEAVGDRLREEGCAATSLSGGLDSSSVTALAAARLGEGQLQAYTAVPGMTPTGTKGYFADEWSRAAEVAAMYPGVEHVAILHGRHEALQLIDRFNAAEMQPIFNPANYDWFYELCLCARQRGSRSVLMGLAGNLTISYDGLGVFRGLLEERRLGAALALGRRMHKQGRSWKAVVHQMLRPALPEAARRGLDTLRGATARIDEYSLIRRSFAQENGLDGDPREIDRRDGRSLRLRNLQRIDPAPTLHAMRRLTGIHISDPTNDRRVVEFCLAVPETAFCRDGVPRSLIRDAMRGLLPESVRTERMRGLQAADFGMRFQAEIPQALQEVRAMARVDLARRCLNLPQMRVMLAQGMAETTSASQVRFWPRLMRGVSLGKFLQVHAEATTERLPAADPPAERGSAGAALPALSPRWDRQRFGLSSS